MKASMWPWVICAVCVAAFITFVGIQGSNNYVTHPKDAKDAVENPVTPTAVTAKPTCLVIDLNKAYSGTLEGKEIMMNIAYKYNPKELELKNRIMQAIKDKNPKLRQMQDEASQEMSVYQQEIEKIRFEAYSKFAERIIPMMEALNPNKMPVFLSTALYKTDYCMDLTLQLTEAYNKAVPSK
jgi:hypothetical protein